MSWKASLRTEYPWGWILHVPSLRVRLEARPEQSGLVVLAGLVEGDFREEFHGPSQAPLAVGEEGEVALGVESDVVGVFVLELLEFLAVVAADPAGGGKIPLLPEYVVGREDQDLLLKNYANRIYRYPDTIGCLHGADPSAGCAMS